MEAKYVKFIIGNYDKIVFNNNLNPSQYPIIHFCHISDKESYLIIKKALELNPHLKISFEVTPHHLLLSNKIKLKNQNYAKVLPPLRDDEHSIFLFEELKKGNIELIGTDHAPHTLTEKSKDFLNAPNGFPGLETYPLVLLNKIFSYELSLEQFVKIASENPSRIFNLKNKGFIREGYDADLVLIDKIHPYSINPQNFRTKAKFSPFENYKTSIQIVKVYLKGKEIKSESSEILGEILHL
jgi:dihydroorotase